MGLFDKLAAPAAASKVGYDFVEIPTEGGGAQRLSKREFEAQPLEKRIQVLVAGTARFYLGGAVVPSGQALRSN